METAPLVHVIVAEPKSLSSVSDPRGTLRALSRLGPEVQIELVHDAESCVEALRRKEADLIVLDSALGPEGDRILALNSESRPPVIVVTQKSDSATALEVFRLGAADCVETGEDFVDLLPVVALEQIRRWRTVRERGATERRILWLERLADAIVSEIPSALAVVDAERRIVTVNPEFCRIWSLSVDLAAGQPLDSVLPHDLLESGRIWELLEEAAHDAKMAPRVARTTGHDGVSRAFDVRAEGLDEAGRLLLVLSDVTAHEAMAKQIAELQRYNENIIQNMNSALLVMDVAGRITSANPTTERILDEPITELRKHAIWDYFPNTPREKVFVTQTLEKGIHFRAAEAILTRRDGSFVSIGISCAPLLDETGAQLGAVAIFQDLSEIKQLREQVQQSEKMASIGQLAAGVAHEINNPMGFIHANLFQISEYISDLQRVWTQVVQLQETVRRGDLAQIQQASQALENTASEVDANFVFQDLATAVQESQDGSERIRHIVRDLREFSHVDTGEYVPSDINQSLDSTANIVWAMMKHSVVLKKEYQDLPRVYCNPMQLKQVFMNLLVNAYQAVEAKIGDTGEAGEIRIATEVQDGFVIVQVQDTGAGISEANLDHIFEPFFTTKEVGEGMGLGLSTCFNIVQRHGGTIRVESQVGRGTLFEVRLPIAGPRLNLNE